MHAVCGDRPEVLPRQRAVDGRLGVDEERPVP
jgi:hypothetical protein